MGDVIEETLLITNYREHKKLVDEEKETSKKLNNLRTVIHNLEVEMLKIIKDQLREPLQGGKMIDERKLKEFLEKYVMKPIDDNGEFESNLNQVFRADDS